MDIQNTICNCKKSHAIIGVFAILFLISITAWFAIGAWDKFNSGSNDPNKPIISVSGTGEIYAKPDLGLIQLSVVTQKKTVAEAMAENTKSMNAVIAAVKSQGVADKDIKTTGFNISPQYEWQKVACLAYPCPDGKNILIGYEVNQQIDLKVRALDKVGDIIQKSTTAGANQVGNLQFTIDDEDAVKKQAREQAITKAQAKAKELASQLGVRLVKIVSFTENGNNPYPMYDYASSKAIGMGGGEISAAPSIQTGENKITVSVSITYEIK
jgi:uncharacterized protein